MEKVNAMTEKQIEELYKLNVMTEKQIEKFYDDCPSGYCVEETRVFDMASLRYVTVKMQYIEN